MTEACTRAFSEPKTNDIRDNASLGISDLCIPESWPSTPNIHAAEAHEATKSLALKFNLITQAQVEKFDKSAFALLAAYACPKSPPERLKIVNDWNSWLFFFDDQADEQYSREGHPLSLEDYMQECTSILRTGCIRQNPTGLELFTLNIRNRISQFASETWLSRFVADVSDYLFIGTLNAARNWTSGITPDISTYLRQRRYDSSLYACETLLELADKNLELDEEVLGNPNFHTLRQICNDVVAFSNDIFSYEKEVLLHKNPNNLLHVLMVNESLSLDQATTWAIRLINSDIDMFMALEQRLLAEIRHDARVIAYLQGLKAWMRGNVLWSLQTGRYTSPTSPFPELRTR